MVRTACLVGSSTQSIRRSTVNGRITSGYLLRLNASRSRSATDQMNVTFSPKLIILITRSPSCPGTSADRNRPNSQSIITATPPVDSPVDKGNRHFTTLGGRFK